MLKIQNKIAINTMFGSSGFNPLSYNPRNLWRYKDVTTVGSTTTWNDTGLDTHLNLKNDTASTQPIATSNVINGKGAVVYDGVDDNTRLLSNNYGLAYGSGQMVAVFRTGANITTAQFIFTSIKSGVNTNYVTFYIEAGYLKFSVVNAAGTILQATRATATNIVANTNYVLSIYSTGTTNKFYLNSTLVATTTTVGTNSGQWFLDSQAGATIVYIGAFGGSSMFTFHGSISEVAHFPYVSDAQCLEISDGYKNEYGI